MRVEQLSNYVAERLASVEGELEAAQTRRRAAARTIEDATARHRRAKAARRRRLRTRPSEGEDAAEATLTAALQEQDAAANDVERLQRQAQGLRQGEEGEATLARELGAALDDDWLLLQGYLTKQGEADGVLVGPTGVWMIEVKNQRGVVNAKSPETWRKQGVHDGRVTRSAHAAADGGGRSWGQQIAGPSRSLRWWLDRNNVDVTIRTAVVLVHPDAYLIVNRNPGVDLLTDDVGELIDRVRSGPHTLAEGTRREIEGHIRHDHDHQTKRRRRAAG